MKYFPFEITLSEKVGTSLYFSFRISRLLAFLDSTKKCIKKKWKSVDQGMSILEIWEINGIIVQPKNHLQFIDGTKDSSYNKVNVRFNKTWENARI